MITIKKILGGPYPFYVIVVTFILLSIAASILIFFICLGNLVAKDNEDCGYLGKVDDCMCLESDVYETHKKGPVPFNHQKHIDSNIDCMVCHHTWNGEEPVKKCSECHDPLETKNGAKKLMLAYHNTCKKCHMDLKKNKKPTGPIMCNDCHRRK